MHILFAKSLAELHGVRHARVDKSGWVLFVDCPSDFVYAVTKVETAHRHKVAVAELEVLHKGGRLPIIFADAAVEVFRDVVEL